MPRTLYSMRSRSLRITGTVSAVMGLLLWQASVAQAQGLGVASLGATGGLTIPSAYVLESGHVALSLGDYQDPKLRTFNHPRNFSLGFGLLPRVEFFGRFAEYTNRSATLPGANNLNNGISDISSNVKWQLPIDLQGLPKLAVGATDISGGAVFFSSQYLVASDEYGPLRWSLGYARGKAPLGQRNGAKVLDGVFGGGRGQAGHHPRHGAG